MYSKDVKRIALNLYNKYSSLRTVESLINVGKSTIQRWTFNFNLKNEKEEYCNIIPFIKYLIDTNTFIHVAEIKKYINDIYNINFSITTIRNLIVHKLHYSYKKITKRLYSQSIDVLLQKQENFMKEIQNIDLDKVICIDETFIYSNIHKNSCWSKKGKRFNYYVKSNPKKYSLIVAISKKGIEKYEIHNCNINTNLFSEFIKDLNKMFNNCYFLLDNVQFHKSLSVKNSMTNNNKLLFIPPYSPHLNPIEEVFSFIKNNVKKFNINQKILQTRQYLNNFKINLSKYYFHSFKKY